MILRIFVGVFCSAWNLKNFCITTRSPLLKKVFISIYGLFQYENGSSIAAFFLLVCRGLLLDLLIGYQLAHCEEPLPSVATTRPSPIQIREKKNSAETDTVPPQKILWFADFESGSIQQWEESKFQTTPCGGEFSGAGGVATLNQQIVHGGHWSLKMVIPGSSVDGMVPGTRMHRWCEPQRHRELFYSVWYFIPRNYTVQKGGWLNWFQFKSKRPSGANDPFFFLDVKNDETTTSMKFMLVWWGGHSFAGPKYDQKGYRTWIAKDAIPVGRWFHIEARYVCAGDFSGAIQVWQDGNEIFYLDQVKTRHDDGDCQWGVNNYGTGVLPSPVTIFIDDASISTFRQGPVAKENK